MTKFKTSLLTAAVVTALALPGLVSAASLSYATGQQITFAKDLFVNDTISIETPVDLQLRATAVDNQTGNITNIVGGETLTVKVTLDNGAVFDSTAAASFLVATFTEGQETGGAGGALNVVPGSENYNAGELNFKYTTTGAGAQLADPNYFLGLNSMKIKQLIQGLFVGSAVSAEITVQNGGGVQVLAARTVLARSAWGITVEGDPTLGDVNKTIDVASQPDRKTLFSPTGAVGGSGVPGDDYFNAGGVNVDITKALETVGAVPTYINNFNATAATPEYNLVNTAKITVLVKGIQLLPFLGNAWLDTSAACTHVAAGSIDAGAALVGGAGGALSFVSNATNPIWNNITAAPPAGPVQLYVCLGADGSYEMNAQNLSGELSVNYNLATQRVNPPVYKFDLLPLRLNGTNFIFQNVNPAGNMEAQSFLRLTNNTSQICPLVIDAKDDDGKHSADVMLTLAPHKSIQLNSEHLEGSAAKSGVTGGFGDGTGKWYVRITAECADMQASALNRHVDGVVTDLTPEKGNDAWLTPPTNL